MKQSKLKLFSIFLLFGILLSLLNISIEKIYFSNNAKRIVLNNGIEKTKEKELVFKRFLSQSEQTLLSIRNFDPFIEYLNGDNSQYNILKSFFLSYTQSQDSFMQLRYIDKNGFEKIRIDRDKKDQKPYKVSKMKLQNKSHRYYFIDSKTKPQNRVWFSALDLNIEHNKIEIPYNPTIRAILPMEENGKFEGILIINYHMEEFIKEFVHTSLYDMILCNNKGYTLYHYDSNKSWGYYQTPKYTIQTDFPSDFKNILQESLFKNETFVSRKLNLPVYGGLTLVLQLKKSYLQAQEKESNYKYLLTTIIILFTSLVFSYFIVQFLSKILLNIKELERLNKNLQKAQEKLKENSILILEQSKLSAMGEMIGNIAHQWRQPLNVISLSASIMINHKQKNKLNDEKFFDLNNKIIENTKYLSQTIDTFRGFIKSEKTSQEIDFKKLLNEPLHLIQDAFKAHNIELFVDVSSKSIENSKIDIVKNEFSQVILNILNNAKDALVLNKIKKPWIKMYIEKTTTDILITIEDNGGGIPQDLLPKIFEPYFTTKHKSKGTGLGLHMTYRIITESFKGKIWAENTEDGVKFFIQLPLQ